jgi:hypothetical protein
MNMTCQICQSELEDFLYGEMKPARASQIRAHLMVCSYCSSAREELEREHEIFSRFYEQTALEPAPGMWETIRSRIQDDSLPQKRSNLRIKWRTLAWVTRPAVLRQTAFALLIILLTATATTFILRRGTDKNIVTVVPSVSPIYTPTVDPDRGEVKSTSPVKNVPSTPRRPVPRLKPLTDEEALNRQIARTEREYQNAIRLLDLAIARRKADFDLGMLKQYEASLALIDNSIAASRRAMRNQPTDLAARQFLFAAYARKVELMQDIAMR